MLRISVIYMFDGVGQFPHRGPSQHNKPHRRNHRHRYPERGWIQFLILRVLYEKPMHGYQLMEELEERGFVLPRRLESGAVYTALRRMEAHGLLESSWEKVETGPDRHIYTVTKAGVQALKTGLETMIKREALIKDLITFYDQHFQRQETAQEEKEG